MKNESAKNSLEKSKNVLEKSAKTVKQKFCKIKTNMFTIIAMNFVKELLKNTCLNRAKTENVLLQDFSMVDHFAANPFSAIGKFLEKFWFKY